ncbi:unnamed protein product [Gongylonema pulchrum]|uniref:Uncharacterized protein n=1 Tax=Gongylonema pulchrum TaxID=637853 RepID=A0A183EEW3_9BILA|nr:unnamed protein product [Gongylonema pulchrum]
MLAAQGSLATQQFQTLITHLEQCVNGVRLLRNEVMTVHNRIVEGKLDNDSGDNGKTLEDRLEFINQIYE